jgi:hypothetical protein
MNPDSSVKLPEPLQDYYVKGVVVKISQENNISVIADVFDNTLKVPRTSFKDIIILKKVGSITSSREELTALNIGINN